MQDKNESKTMSRLLPKIARRIGEKSVSNTCIWWVHQPKVPKGMKK